MAYKKKYESVYGKIPKGYEIHHIDHNRKNNDLSNLIDIPKDLHRKYHKLFQKADCVYHPSDLMSNTPNQNNISVNFDIWVIELVHAYLKVKTHILGIKEQKHYLSLRDSRVAI